MSKRLIFRRSLYQEFSDDESLKKVSNKQNVTRISIKLNNTVISVGVILLIVIASLRYKEVQDIAKDKAMALLNLTSDWCDCISHVKSLLLAICVSIFTMTICYLDSDVPGIRPPSTFSKSQALQYKLNGARTSYLSFLVSIGSGVVTFFLLII